MHRIDLVMIVRDEERCLARCLASARPWVDGIVVLDTGSADSSVAIARAAGARVERFAWSDDFAAARNAALQISEAPWRLVLDADEWIEAGGGAIAALRDVAPSFVGRIQVASRFGDDASAGEAPSWLPRLLPHGVSYSGRIHEQPASALPRRRLPVRVGHDGYLPAQRAAKRGRNARLLGLALAADPDDAYLHYQLGKDLELDGRFDAAVPHYARALAACDARAGFRHDLVLRMLFALKKLGRFEAAIALAETEMPRWPQSPDFFFTVGDLCLDWAAARPEQAAALLPMVESSWVRATEIGEQPQLQDTVRGRGSYLAAHNLAVLHAGLGRDAEAAAWRQREATWRAAGAAPA